MANLNPAEDSGQIIRKLIEEGRVGAISIDTTVFDDNGKQFDRGVFAQLRQFKKHPQQLIISEIVMREISSHYIERIGKTRSRFDRDMVEVARTIGGTSEMVEYVQHHLNELPNVSDFCNRHIEDFIEGTSAIILNADDYISVSDIVSLYFDQKPPFHVENLKKKEFPDAIALATLQRWAESTNCEVVVVSRDKDWEAFCASSTVLHLLKDLPDALSIFLSPDEILEAMKRRLLAALMDPESEIFSQVKADIENYDWDNEISVESYSSFEYDEDFEVHIEEIKFVTGRNAIKITEADEEMVSMSFDFEIKGNIDLHCSFRKWDGADREYVSLGHESYGHNLDLRVTVLVKMEVSQGELKDIDELELQPERFHADFGEIEPDWSGRGYE